MTKGLGHTGGGPAGPSEWQPYAPPEGSFVELLPDGGFRLEGDDRAFGPDDAVSVDNVHLTARKPAGVGQPLTVTLHRGAEALAVQLRFTGEPTGPDGGAPGGGWVRRDLPPGSDASRVGAAPRPPQGGAVGADAGATSPRTPDPAPPTTPRARGERAAALLSRINGELLFRWCFFVFLGWYLLAYQGVFRADPPEPSDPEEPALSAGATDPVIPNAPAGEERAPGGRGRAGGVPQGGARGGGTTTGTAGDPPPKPAEEKTAPLYDGGYDQKPPGWR